MFLRKSGDRLAGPCREKGRLHIDHAGTLKRGAGIKPPPGRRKSGALFHVPLHGTWSDYTGFTEDRRSQYYENVRAIAMEYGIEMLDLTGYEYEPYFMCDTMHLGWKGWLAVDRALIDFYYDR